MTHPRAGRQLQQLLRVHDRQGGRRGRGGRVRVAAVDRRRRGDGPQAEGLRPGRGAQARPAGGAGLSDAVRRGMVDGDPLGRAPAGPAARPGRADGRGEVRRVPDPARPRRASRSEGAGARTGPTSRGCGWTRRCTRSRILAAGLYGRELPAQNGAPLAAGGPLEVRVQGDQVDRQDHRSSPSGRRRRGTPRPRRSTGSSRTSIRTSPTRAGARRPSSGSASRAGGRR